MTREKALEATLATGVHTPGPWNRNIKPATKYTTVWSGRNTHVAYVAVGSLTPEAVEANINLIAAAPDMLAALRAFLSATWSLDLPPEHKIWRARDAAKAAERSATGRGAP